MGRRRKEEPTSSIVTEEMIADNPELRDQVNVGDVVEYTPVKFLVTKPFRDINDFSRVYQTGEDITHLGSSRIEHLLEIGYIKEQKA